eukprot:2313178-Prymnesium_polylepis.1
MLDSEAEDTELKLIDFGLAQRVTPEHESFDDGFGTLFYMAPEMFEVWCMRFPGTYRLCYDSAIDVWAAGVVVYQLLCGNFPFGLGEQEEDSEEVAAVSYTHLTLPTICSV